MFHSPHPLFHTEKHITERGKKMRCDLSGWEQTIMRSEWLVFNCRSKISQAYKEASSTTYASECSDTCSANLLKIFVQLYRWSLLLCIFFFSKRMSNGWREWAEKQIDGWMESRDRGRAENGHWFWHLGSIVCTRVLRWNHPKPSESDLYSHTHTHAPRGISIHSTSQSWLWL